MNNSTSIEAEYQQTSVVVESKQGAALRVERIELSTADRQNLTTGAVSIEAVSVAPMSEQKQPE